LPDSRLLASRMSFPVGTGLGSDSFALAIAHRDARTATLVLDAVRERKPKFVPAAVIADLAQLLKSYRIHEVSGDAYAGGFHSSEWSANGIRFVPCERSTSENYLSMLPQLLAGRVRLIDNTTLRSQLGSLERKVSAADREQVSTPPTLTPTTT
jgi:hypothetical protein